MWHEVSGSVMGILYHIVYCLCVLLISALHDSLITHLILQINRDMNWGFLALKREKRLSFTPTGFTMVWKVSFSRLFQKFRSEKYINFPDICLKCILFFQTKIGIWFSETFCSGVYGCHLVPESSRKIYSLLSQQWGIK